MSAVLFFIAGIGAIAGATGVVILRDPFYAVLSLVVHLLFLAVLFLLLRAEFVAAGQVVVYAGAVMVLYVFVVAYVGDQAPLERHLRGSGPVGSLQSGQGPLRLPAAVVFGAVLAVELMIALLGTGLKAVDGYGAGYVPGFGSPRFIGNLLLTRFLLVFEVASFLLLIAAVGAVVLARRRGGLDDREDVFTPLELPVPRGTGTMLEAGVSLSFAAAHTHEAGAEEEHEAEQPALSGEAGSRGGGW